jgi:glycine/D-amino acid oxidase-like deaminating enzyme
VRSQSSGVAADVVVIGAGMIGVACAYFCARAGLSVILLERGAIASGTSSAGEGNLLLSDKAPGPELELAWYSLRVWRVLATEHGERFEFDAKGGLVVAATEAQLAALHNFADGQRVAGVRAESVPAEGLAALEPMLAPGLAGGVYYPEDAQVQPMLAAAHLLRVARERYGVTVRTHTEVLGLLGDERVTGVSTSAGPVAAGVVVNAAGVCADRFGALPIAPRRGFVLVTEPLPNLVRHKVYAADYVADVAAGTSGLRTSAVVEGTRAGTVLIGASRERVGFDRTLSLPALRALAANAIALFPFLADVLLVRAYCGFRPYCPDHLPVIGADPHRTGLWHATGHEGAGIGLGPGTGALLAQLIIGQRPIIDPEPFRANRFTEAPA